ncbi:hypothetical protein D8674_002340 [Pyrus ussuriensis x Pyrus communis]|uniref:Plant bHLH transcription factor ACT-like domain-containing protein n=1 Tax=Pyrus ussuriensis x Pyrus communis TaxID=2448454 RepID=A0A5N5FE14_9ROSA|nr:uncharacterized protein LOC103944059 [Pyrus x bretschneideri]KAB2601335.1 hypothetical protein D8674_002340 [Pyrus ussuriensis x Pyrus communis]
MRAIVSGMRKRAALRRKLQILRSLTKTKSVKRSSIIMDALFHIYMLKLKLEAVQREYLHLMAIKTGYIRLIKHLQVPKEVKVEKIKEGFLVRVKCEKAKDTLVSVLEAFEEMGLNVVQGRVSCNNYFSMEAIAAVADGESKDQMDVRVVTQAILRATEINQNGKETRECIVVPQVNNS